MICRKLHLTDQPQMWLMISQVEHASISGLLAGHCCSHLDSSLRDELIQAVVHHDDGWKAWEAKPQLDETKQRPLAFYELPLKYSLEIWSRSIEAANKIGPRAAWVVASHFIALLEARPEPRPAHAEAWRAEMVEQRNRWQAAWHSRELAQDSLHWLQLLDIASLWLCGKCPGQGEVVAHRPEGYTMGANNPLKTEFLYLEDRASMQPWRLDVEELKITATGWIAPAREYADSDELLAHRIEHAISWKIVIS